MSYCDYCDDKNCKNTYKYSRFSHDPLGSPISINGRNKSLYYGVELEVDLISGDWDLDRSDYMFDDVSRAYNRLVNNFTRGFADYKEDGSLSETGMEIVTRPATVKHHAFQWKKFLNGTDGIHAPRSCGMHVHVSRTGLTDLQIGRMVHFVNHASNHKFITSLAGRICQDYAALDLGFTNKTISEYLRGWSTRYRAVNLNPNYTIEFRLFASTASYFTFMVRLEFVEALVHFSATGNSSHRKGNRKNFIKYAHKVRTYINGKSRLRWPHLAAWIDAAWLGVETRLTEKYNLECGLNNERNN